MPGASVLVSTRMQVLNSSGKGERKRGRKPFYICVSVNPMIGHQAVRINSNVKLPTITCEPVQIRLVIAVV
jgi:hypothetical protein